MSWASNCFSKSAPRRNASARMARERLQWNCSSADRLDSLDDEDEAGEVGYSDSSYQTVLEEVAIGAGGGTLRLTACAWDWGADEGCWCSDLDLGLVLVFVFVVAFACVFIFVVTFVVAGVVALPLQHFSPLLLGCFGASGIRKIDGSKGLINSSGYICRAWSALNHRRVFGSI